MILLRQKQKIIYPYSLTSSFRRKAVGIFVLGYVGTSFLLQLVGTDSKTVGFQRDCRFLGFWVSKRGESAMLAHDFAMQSLVCYTFCDRGWLKGVGRWRSKHFEVAVGQADFGSTRFRNSGFDDMKSGCPGVGDAAYFFCITGGARGISHSRLPSRGTSASCDAPCCRSDVSLSFD